MWRSFKIIYVIIIFGYDFGIKIEKCWCVNKNSLYEIKWIGRVFVDYSYDEGLMFGIY